MGSLNDIAANTAKWVSSHPIMAESAVGATLGAGDAYFTDGNYATSMLGGAAMTGGLTYTSNKLFGSMANSVSTAEGLFKKAARRV